MPDARHVLGLSGGRDSAALAVYMSQNHPELDIEYFFTDTGNELPEVYEYLGKLEGLLGKRVARLNPKMDFDFWLKRFRYYLPSPDNRWCTRVMKIKPLLDWLKPTREAGIPIHSYVAIRADETSRTGLTGEAGITVHLPFVEDGLDKADVINILKSSGLGLPSYYDWRTRSGCTFCFYQREIEWVRLRKKHPEAFELAKKYEHLSKQQGHEFTWVQGRKLEDFEDPEKVKAMEESYKKRLEQFKKKSQPNPLRPLQEIIDDDDLYGGSGKYCVMCHK